VIEIAVGEIEMDWSTLFALENPALKTILRGSVMHLVLFVFLRLTIGGGLLGLIVLLIIAAVILMISDRFLPGFEVHGFTGAIIAAIAIAVVSWLVNWLLGLLGVTF
jgi:uncharacterized membrane protein YvlD (DUF360 family)